jgi:hypothetical protein
VRSYDRPTFQVADAAAVNWIDADKEHNRDRGGLPLDRSDCNIAVGHDHVRPQANQLCRVDAKAIGITGSPTNIDPHISAVSPPQGVHCMVERTDTRLSLRIIAAKRSSRSGGAGMRVLRSNRNDRSGSWLCENEI